MKASALNLHPFESEKNLVVFLLSPKPLLHRQVALLHLTLLEDPLGASYRSLVAVFFWS